jgi:tetratricopeptide (TPR) repeat protein
MNLLRKVIGNANSIFALRMIASSRELGSFQSEHICSSVKYVSKVGLTILAFGWLACFPVFAAEGTSAKLQKYISTARPFELPASFDTTDEEQCKLLVEANPKRFEARIVLAMVLSRNDKIDEALDEFRRADEFASREVDRDILAALPYEDVYALVLFAAAHRRFNARTDELSALRMLQQAVGMDTSKLSEKKRLAQCYMMMAGLYLKRGLYDRAIESATKGIEIAKVEGHTDFIPVLDEIKVKAKEFKSKKP